MRTTRRIGLCCPAATSWGGHAWACTLVNQPLKHLPHPCRAPSGERTALRRSLHATSEALEACRAQRRQLEAAIQGLQGQLLTAEADVRRTHGECRALRLATAAADDAHAQASAGLLLLAVAARCLWTVLGAPGMQNRLHLSRLSRRWRTCGRSVMSWAGMRTRRRAFAGAPTSACRRRRRSLRRLSSARASCGWTTR